MEFGATREMFLTPYRIRHESVLSLKKVEKARIYLVQKAVLQKLPPISGLRAADLALRPVRTVLLPMRMEPSASTQVAQGKFV